jgi:hypothetical protein
MSSVVLLTTYFDFHARAGFELSGSQLIMGPELKPVTALMCSLPGSGGGARSPR